MKCRKKKRRHIRRYGVVETLEVRQMLTSNWQNVGDPYNVDDDPQGIVGVDDANLVIAELQNRLLSDPATGKLLSETREPAQPYLDVDGDGYVAPIDLIRVLNHFRGPVVDCFFDGDDSDWVVLQSGWMNDPGSVTSVDCAAIIHEGDSFSTSLSRTFTVTEATGSIEIEFAPPEFDVSSEFHNDAFEISVVDADGNPLVANFIGGRDAAVNMSEGTGTQSSSAVLLSDDTVTIGLDGIPNGTEATLNLRLINNDGDSGSTATIRNVEFSDTLVAAGLPSGLSTVNRAILAASAPTGSIEIAAGSSAELIAIQSSTGRNATISISAEAPQGIVAPGSRLVVSGRVEWLEGNPPNSRFDYVTAKGKPVDVFDANGNFFTVLEIQAGSNPIELVGYTNDGRSVTTSLNIMGEEENNEVLSLSRLDDVTGDFVVAYGTSALKENSPVLFTDVTLRNGGTDTFFGPVAMVIRNISDPSVVPLDPWGFTSDGSPYYEFESTSGSFSPDELSNAASIGFLNPNGTQFDYALTFLAASNAAPEIESLPVIETVPDRHYEYAVVASDTDGDSLAYSLRQHPANASISDSGVISWTPTSADVGNQQFQVAVSDGRGGIAQQSFTVSVLPARPNRPPVITSTPITKAELATSSEEVEQVFDVRNWTVVQYDMEQGAANWQLNGDGTQAHQVLNADASILLSDQDLENDRIRGTWEVTSASDDDLMGFVFGYQDEGHFYLFDWKQGDQDDPLGFAERGMSVKVVSADSILTGEDLWPTNGNGNRVRTLYHDPSPFGWEDVTRYDFQLDHRPGSISITIERNGSILRTIEVADNTYDSGRFGFYNYSQEGVRYQGFERQSLREATYNYQLHSFDPDGDPLEYGFVQAPTGMSISADGLITWGPTADQFGNHEVIVRASDGRGGEANQRYIVCICADPLNNAPFIISDPVKSHVLGNDPYEYQLVAIDPDGDDLSFVLSDDASGKGFTLSDTGLLSWDSSQVGKHAIHITANDGRGGRDEQIYDLVVSPQGTGVIRGVKFEDADGDGIRHVERMVEVNVPGTSDPWLAGMPDGSRASRRTTNGDIADTAPEHSPVLVNDLKMVPGDILQFAATGLVSHDVTLPLVGPDGDIVGARHFARAENGISDFRAPMNSLVGVFLDDEQPDSTNAPPTPQYERNQQKTLPLLKQLFFIGDGITDEGSIQDFVVPSGATRLFLGTMDTWGWFNNIGSFDVEVRVIESRNNEVFHLPEAIVTPDTNEGQDGFVLTENLEPTDTLRALISGTVEFNSDNRANYSADWNAAGVVVRARGSRLDKGVTDPAFTDIGWLRLEIGNDDIGYFALLDPEPLHGLGSDNPPEVLGLNRLASDVFGGSFTGLPAGTELFYRIFDDPLFDNLGEYRVQSTSLPTSDDGLEGWTIYLDENNNGIRDVGEVLTTTDAQGQYEFLGLPVGEYTVREEMRLGWTQTTPINGFHSVTLANGSEVDGIDFGNSTIDVLNRAPALSGLADAQLDFGVPFTVTAEATDPDSDQVIFSLPIAPTGATIHPDLGTLVWTPTQEQSGEHVVVIAASDGRGGTDQISFTLTVSQPNTPPVFTSTPPRQASPGRPYYYPLVAQDADGQEISYRLDTSIPGMSIQSGDDGSYALSWLPPSAALGSDIPITIIANDSSGGGSQQSYTLSIVDAESNTAPTINSMPTTRAVIGRAYRYEVMAADVDGDPIQFSLSSGPSGLTISNRGVVTWMPTSTGLFDVDIQVSDGQGGTTTQTYEVTVVSQGMNSAPVIESNPSVYTSLNTPYIYQVAANDAEGDPLLFELLDAPLGMSVNPRTGDIRWTPNDQQLGEHSVSIRVFDPSFAIAIQTFSIEVVCSNFPPAITSVPPTTANVGDVYLYPLLANDPESDALSWSLGEAPTGMTISETGVINWRPDASDVGTSNVVVEVSDGFNTAIQSYAVVTNPADSEEANQPPVIRSRPVFAAGTNLSYEYPVIAFDPEGAQISYSLTGEIPAGMNISGGGRITWQPTGADEGEYFITVIATDDKNASATQSYLLSVATNNAPIIQSTPPTEVTAGTDYRYSVNAQDADGDSLTYSLVHAPDDMTIDAFGRIRWQTFVGDGDAADVEVSVSDGRGGTDNQTWTISLEGDTEAPEVSITIATVDGGNRSTEIRLNAGTEYSAWVRASDNVDVTDLSLVVDGTPVALNSVGLAYFEANQQGQVEFVATANDAAGNQGEATTIVTSGDAADINRPVPDDPTLPDHPGFAPTDNGQPTVVITSPELGASVTNAVPIIGTVDDPEDNLWYYRVFIGRADRVSITDINLNDPDWVLIKESTEEVIDGELAVFDPSNLSNDAYSIVVAGFDVNGFGFAYPTTVFVEGNVTLDNFRLDFTDLSIPLSGIPIEITRVYDTLNSEDEGDFGFGWTMGVADPMIFEAVALGVGGALTFSNDKFVPDRTKVYLTNPDGDRIGFTYREEIVSQSFFGAELRAYFDPDPGVYDTLTIDDSMTFRGGIAGGLVAGLNPDRYTLTRQDGTVYVYDQFTGIESITDRNGNTALFSEDGVMHSSGESIEFRRDHRGRIREIVDPAGNVLTYQYDAAGDLREFTDQAGVTTRYNYRDTPDHFLDEVIDARGNRVLKAVYEQDADTGQWEFKGVVDAFGNRVDERSFEAGQNFGIIRDGNGNATELRFDDRGNVLEEIDPNGNVTIREYNDPRNPDLETRIVDPRGFETLMEYDARGNMTRQTDALGQVWRWTYNQSNDVTSVTDPRGFTTRNSYDESGNLVSVTDSEGNVTSSTFDASGRKLTETDADGNTWQFEYNGSSTEPIRVTNPDGTTRGSVQNGLALFTSYTDENGDTVEFVLDDAGRLVQLIDPLNGTTTTRFDGDLVGSVTDERGFTTNYEYDGNNRTITEVDPLGGRYEYEYDSQGNVVAETDEGGNRTEFEYDARNLLVLQRDALGFETSYAYDESQNLISIVDAKGRTTRFEYDGLNRQTAMVDAAGSRWVSQYDAVGNLIKTIDPRGAETSWEYDGLNRITKQTDALGGEQIWAYDSRGNVVSYIDQRGNETAFEYDDRNRLISVTDPAGFTELFAYDGSENVVAYTDQAGAVTSFVYDTLGRLISAEAANGAKTSYSYDAASNLSGVTDPLGRETRYSYDALNRLTIETDPRGAVTSYAYDSVGNVVSLTDPVGNETTWDFDELNRVIERIDPLGSSEMYSYDEVSNLDSYIDRLGRIREYSFDTLDRLVEENWLAPDRVAVNEIGYVYDAVGNLTATTDSDSGASFSYDLLNRVIASSNAGTPGIPTVTLTSSYDAAGNRTSVADNFGVTLTSDYDARNQLEERSWSGGGVDPANYSLAYSARGNATRMERRAGGNLVGASVRSYDNIGRIRSIDHLNATDQSLLDFDYQFDLADQLSQWTIDGNRTDFEHDDAGQVISADRQLGDDEQFEWDLNGNSATTETNVGDNNRLLSDEQFDYQYDAEGNLISQLERATGIETRYEYDHDNRMIRATVHSDGQVISEIEYRFDALGRRIARIVDSDGDGSAEPTTEAYVYDGDRVWLDADKDGNVTARYMFGDNVDEIVARWTPTEGTAWHLADHLGSMHAVVDNAGTVLASVTYNSFGGIVASTNLATMGRYLFTGREFDSVLGSYYYRARMFNPISHRFNSEDPIRFRAGDTNLNRYVTNQPGIATDPSGLTAAKEYGILTTAINLARLAVRRVGREIRCILQIVASTLRVIGTGQTPIKIVRRANRCYVEGRGCRNPNRGSGSAASAAKDVLGGDRVGSALSKTDAFHRAPSFLSFSQLASGKVTTFTGGDGIKRRLLQVPGGVNDIQGVFEFIIDPDCRIPHQRFKPGGNINGRPN